MALLATLLLAAAHLASAQSSLRLRFLDVGQGDAILITNGGRTVLVDTGPTDDIAPHLRRLGVDTIDLLIITHTDLAPYVGASLDVMESDTQKVRDGRPYVFTDLLRREKIDEIVTFIERMGGLGNAAAAE